MHRLFASLAALLLASGQTWAADGCTSITTAPATISAAGNYCLEKNLKTTTNAITINASDVVLDCGGHVIDGLAITTTSTAIGVRASGKNNVTVKNCTIKGFAEGISLAGFGHTVTDNSITGSLVRGIKTQGDNNLVRGNRVSDIGGTTNTSYTVMGIMTTGTSDVRDNTVSGVAARTLSGKGAYGIYSLTNDVGTITGNTVRNLVADGAGMNMAITAYNSVNAVIDGNQASNPPSTHGYAFYCSGSGSVSRGNIAQGYTLGTSSTCVDAGSNVSP